MTGHRPPGDWDAVAVAGGRSRRMGGGDKTALEIGGRPMLDRVLDALHEARTIVVVGTQRPTDADVVWCREEPAGGGPAAAIAVALEHVDADLVVVVAGDQPFLDAPTVESLVRAVLADGAVAVDDSGRPQWLCSAWRSSVLRASTLTAGASLKGTLGALQWTPVPVDGVAAVDCDTPEDLRRARELAR